MLQAIVFHTLGQLATGILLFICLVPPSRIGRGFGRFHTGLALALWMLGLWGKFPAEFFVLAVLIAFAFAFSFQNRLYYPFLIPALFTSLYMLLKPDLAQTGWMIGLWIHLPPVLVLGASAVAMLLGHWYLVAPKLSITYLKILTIGLIVSILLRSGLLVEAISSSRLQMNAIHFYDVYGIFFLQRVGLGLVLTLILSVLTYFCVRIRSTQSATGILYVVVVFCLIGELIGAYLFAKTGIPL